MLKGPSYRENADNNIIILHILIFRLHKGEQLPIRHSSQGVLHRQDQDRHQVVPLSILHSLHEGSPPVLLRPAGEPVLETSRGGQDKDTDDSLQVCGHHDREWVTHDPNHIGKPNGQLHQA